jgi:hypothetical protein
VTQRRRENGRRQTTPPPRHRHAEAESPSETTLQLQIPGQLIEEMAQRVAELLRNELASINTWMDAAYPRLDRLG